MIHYTLDRLILNVLLGDYWETDDANTIKLAKVTINMSHCCGKNVLYVFLCLEHAWLLVNILSYAALW